MSIGANIEACKICGNKNHSLLIKRVSKVVMKADGEYSIMRCKECTHCFTSPIPSDKYLAKAYENFGPHKNHPSYKRLKRLKFIKNHKIFGLFYVVLYKLVGARFSPFFKSNKRHMLDVGCGSGQFLIDMKQLGWEVTGQDMYKGAGQFAIDEGIDINICSLSSMSEDSLNMNRFDIITGWHVLEHTHEPIEFVKAIYKMLKPGGKIVIEVPNADCLERYIFGKDWWSWMTPIHLQHFNKTSLKKVMLDSGFIEIRGTTKKTHIIHSLRKKRFPLKKVLGILSWILQMLTGTGSVVYVTASKPS